MSVSIMSTETMTANLANNMSLVARVYGLPYYFTLEKFIVSKDSLANSQSFYLQWFQIIQYGVLNEVQAESYLMGPIAAGTQVSSTLVPAVLKRFRIEESVMD